MDADEAAAQSAAAADEGVSAAEVVTVAPSSWPRQSDCQDRSSAILEPVPAEAARALLAAVAAAAKIVAGTAAASKFVAMAVDLASAMAEGGARL